MIAVGKMVLAVVLGLAAWRAAAAEQILRAPKLATPPTIDGVLDPAEWGGAAAFTAFRGTHHTNQDAYPESLRMVWYLAYDDTNLYLAMDAHYPESITLKADGKAADADNEYVLIRDDHVEISVAAVGRDQAVQAGYGFYKMMVNPRGVFSDVWNLCGTPGNEALWSSGATVRSGVRPGNWQLEVAWPLKSMKVKRADHAELLVQLARAVSGVGWYFASWGPGGWMGFDQIPRVVLDPDVPAFRFLRKGEWVDGDLDVLLEWRGKPGGAIARVVVRDATGAAVYDQTQPLAAATRFQEQDLPVPETGNTVELTAWTGDRLLYQAAVPFRKYTAQYRQDNLDTWLASRPEPGQYQVETAYYPSRGALRVRVDLDVFGGLPAKLAGARAVRATVAAAAGNVIGTATVPITDLAASLLVQLGDLPEGDYTTRIALLDAAGSAVDERTTTFVRRHYPWEGTMIGEELVVVPPYRPITRAGNELRTVLGAVTVGAGGLPTTVHAGGTTIVDAPVRLEARIDGQAVAWAGDVPAVELVPGRRFPAEFDRYCWQKSCPRVPLTELPETDGYAARITGTGRAGNLRTDVAATLGYDGCLSVALDLKPAVGTVTVDALDLVVPLWAGADVIFAGRGYEGARQGRLPEGDGVLWESAADVFRPKGFRGTWVPYVYLGNGGAGLWYLAASDAGWHTADDRSCVVVERRDGRLQLRLSLINVPTPIADGRRIELALQTMPATPRVPGWRRLLWERPHPSMTWFNTGWRVYGWGGDDFYLPRDDDYRDLGRWIVDPAAFDTKPPRRHLTLRMLDRIRQLGPYHDQVPIVMYSSHYIISASLPELETYAGEWAGKNDLRPNVDYFADRRKLGQATDFLGRYTWDTVEKVSELGAMWPPSLLDCYLWYHRKLVELADTNGTFWDNAGVWWFRNADVGLGYVRDDGHVQPMTNIFVRRELARRLHVMGWLAGKPPVYLPNSGSFDFPYGERLVLIEGQWYIQARDGSIFDGVPDMDAVRAGVLSRGIPPLLVTLAEKWPFGATGTSHRPVRSVLAMSVLHDFACTRLSFDQQTADTILDMLDREIGYFTGDPEFLPYWDNAGVARLCDYDGKRLVPARPEHVYASVYRDADRVMVWLVNEHERDATYYLWLDDQALLGRRAERLRDAESGVELTRLPAVSGDPLSDRAWAHIHVPAQDFRALILE